MKKKYFSNRKHFLRFFKNRNCLKMTVLLENIIEKEVKFFIIVFYMILDDIHRRSI